jgi:hypothetical protein
MARERIDETKITRLMAIREANIEAELAAERDFARHNIFIPGMTAKPKRPDRTLEKALHADLSIPEIVEFDRRRKAKARECWLAGDETRKVAWGYW